MNIMSIRELKDKVKVKLPPILTAHHAESLCKVLADSLSTRKSVEISAEHIQEIDTHCAQILLASRLDCESQNIIFRVSSPSKRLVNKLNVLGIELYLTQRKKAVEHR